MQNQPDAIQTAINAIQAALPRPVLYGPDNRPLKPSGSYAYQREGARRTGTMKNWIPRRLFGKDQEALERLTIVERSIELTNNDPNAAGIVDNIATYVIGSGLTPHITLDAELLGIDKDQARIIQKQMLNAYWEWAPFADSGGRMNFGQIQYLTKTSMLKHGEYFVLLPMIKDPMRPFSLACQVIHPLRVRTPTDMANQENMKDGIELGSYGETTAVWVKKTDPRGMLPDSSKYFVRIPTKRGHRFNIIHNFVTKDPEQVRGFPIFAAALKYFKDFSDLLNAELVSNIVTAALSYFVEVQQGDPYNVATNFATITEPLNDADGSGKNLRYQEVEPGQILYGNVGEKPHLLAAQRPGVTFEPFTKVVKKSLSMAANLPYPILWKDVEGVNFAGFRSAMLDAWRVFTMERDWHGQDFCQPIWAMLQEEAWLRNRLDITDFYERRFSYTRVDWRGSPKGDIEPVKAAQANILKNKNNMKTIEKILAESGEDYESTLDQLEQEQLDRDARGLTMEDDDTPDDQNNEETNTEG